MVLVFKLLPFAISLQLSDLAGVGDLIVELSSDRGERYNGIIIDVQDEGAFVLTCAHLNTFTGALSLQCMLRIGRRIPSLRISCLTDSTGTVIDAAIFFAFSQTAFRGISAPRWTKAPSGMDINT